MRLPSLTGTAGVTTAKSTRLRKDLMWPLQNYWAGSIATMCCFRVHSGRSLRLTLVTLRQESLVATTSLSTGWDGSHVSNDMRLKPISSQGMVLSLLTNRAVWSLAKHLTV